MDEEVEGSAGADHDDDDDYDAAATAVDRVKEPDGPRERCNLSSLVADDGGVAYTDIKAGLDKAKFSVVVRDGWTCASFGRGYLQSLQGLPWCVL